MSTSRGSCDSNRQPPDRHSDNPRTRGKPTRILVENKIIHYMQICDGPLQYVPVCN